MAFAIKHRLPPPFMAPIYIHFLPHFFPYFVLETFLSVPIFALLLKVGGLDLPILDMRENGSGRSAFISVAIIPFPVLDLRHYLLTI